MDFGIFANPNKKASDEKCLPQAEKAPIQSS